MEPKTEKKEPEKKEGAEPVIAEQNVNEQRYQAEINLRPVTHLTDAAIFIVKDGLVMLPVDDLGRPFPASFFLSPKLLDRLAGAMGKFAATDGK